MEGHRYEAFEKGVEDEVWLLAFTPFLVVVQDSGTILFLFESACETELNRFFAFRCKINCANLRRVAVFFLSLPLRGEDSLSLHEKMNEFILFCAGLFVSLRYNREDTLSRHKKEQDSFVLHSTFRIFAMSIDIFVF